MVLKQGYSAPKAAQVLGIASSFLYRWKKQLTQGSRLTVDEKAELSHLYKEVKQLRMEQEILKKASAYFAKHVK